MRIAWIGPMPGNVVGASGVSNHLLRELGLAGVDIDCFVPGRVEDIPENLKDLQRVKFICEASAWKWGSWYSRNRLMSFVTGQIANLRAENRLAVQLVQAHEKNPYDLVYQFSHIELSILRRFRKKLPPIVLHPSVHAAGELRWHRAEVDLSRASESYVMRTGARVLLAARTIVQKRHIRYADIVLGLSQNFAGELVRDYVVSPDKLRIVPNPIDLEHFAPPEIRPYRGRILILYVSRIAVRKGVEMVIELSHRLNDLRGQVEIQVVGGKSQWSDYTHLLKRLNPHTANYIGEVGKGDGGMLAVYQRADVLIQPSHYEPFGLTVGEALACGVPVVVSDKVGAAEHVHSMPCRIFPDGDTDAMEREVRCLIKDMKNSNTSTQIRNLARTEADRLFSVPVIASQLLGCLESVTSETANGGRLQAHFHSIW